MSDYTPTNGEVRLAYIVSRSAMDTTEYARKFAPLFGPEYDAFIAHVKAEAWDEGHKHRRRLGQDECQCDAWNIGECACGLYGTGELLSLNDNPYREVTE